MKTIYLVRHGKASMNHQNLTDEDRPLLVKGENNTKYIADKLLNKGVSPDLIISSHAVRALETAKIIAAILKYPENQIKIDRQVYFSDGEGLFDEFYDLPNTLNSVMLVGHNPSISAFANAFLDNKIDSMPTSGAIGIKININDWKDIINTKGVELFRKFKKPED